MKIKGGKWSKSNDSINNIKVSGNDLLKPCETSCEDGKKNQKFISK